MTRRFGTAFIAALMLWAVVLVPGTASAQVAASNPPATPQIGGSRTSGGDGTIERALQITQCGNTMYVGGTFTQVRNPGSQTPITRRNAFAFSATAPYMITNWNPNVNGEVNTVACGTDGSVFVGGNLHHRRRRGQPEPGQGERHHRGEHAVLVPPCGPGCARRGRAAPRR